MQTSLREEFERKLDSSIKGLPSSLTEICYDKISSSLGNKKNSI